MYYNNQILLAQLCNIAMWQGRGGIARRALKKYDTDEYYNLGTNDAFRWIWQDLHNTFPRNKRAVDRVMAELAITIRECYPRLGLSVEVAYAKY